LTSEGKPLSRRHRKASGAPFLLDTLSPPCYETTNRSKNLVFKEFEATVENLSAIFGLGCTFWYYYYS